MMILTREDQMSTQQYPYIVIDLSGHEGWLKGRQKGIGGSDAASVLGSNPFKTNVQLWEEKTGIRKPEDISDKSYVRYGTAAEPLIRELFKLDYPEYTVEHHENRILRSTIHPFMQASLDGELTDRDGRRGILEIKTSNMMSASSWSKWEDRIPDNYYCQILHYLLVTGWDFAILRAHLITSRGDDVRTSVRHYFIERSDVEDDLDYLAKAEQEFWDMVKTGRRPALILPEI